MSTQIATRTKAAADDDPMVKREIDSREETDGRTRRTTDDASATTIATCHTATRRRRLRFIGHETNATHA